MSTTTKAEELVREYGIALLSFHARPDTFTTRQDLDAARLALLSYIRELEKDRERVDLLDAQDWIEVGLTGFPEYGYVSWVADNGNLRAFIDGELLARNTESEI